jgi:uncharacterized OsmC-like protein
MGGKRPPGSGHNAELTDFAEKPAEAGVRLISVRAKNAFGIGLSPRIAELARFMLTLRHRGNALMDRTAEIRAAQERVIAVYRKKPQTAFSTTHASAHIDDGLTCAFRQGDHQAVMDMSKVLGGDEKGPTPGFFIRAGLAGCVAIGIKLAATREAIAIDAIDVDIEMDFDDSAMFGIGSNTAAPLETRFIITLKSPTPWEEVTAMVDRALAIDPFFVALRDAQKVSARLVAGKG